LSRTRAPIASASALYARAGVPEYWIVDPDADRVGVHRLEQGGYGKPEILEPGDGLTTSLLPGFALGVAELFAR
jgi:Uma2 family endonuclease